jgi:hypothetical protein
MSKVNEISRDAYHEQIASGRVAELTDAIFKVLEAAHKNGIKDMSGREIQQELKKMGMEEESGTISGRVKTLVDKKRLFKDRVNKRHCMHTGVLIGPLSIPAIQDRIGL